MRISSQEEVLMTTYSLTKQAREWKGKGTHATAVIQALKALDGKATGSAIADFVEEKKLLAGSEMDQREACSWVLCYLVRTGVLRAKESK
jgi:hypothetical protein